jgi:asparagine synthase (glutamine-hydrolysing)
MCGIGGVFSFSHSRDDLLSIVAGMGEAIRYRGPDSHGEWLHPELPVAFLHRRLAILDLTPEGHQPMHSPSRRYTITFNGEVYNFAEIRGQLVKAGYSFRGGSDTEVMLAAFDAYGIEEAVQLFNGMFAFGVFDAHDRSLTLVRDRLGVKPLYYTVQPWGCAFASELKPFLKIPNVHWTLNSQALALMIRMGFIPSPYSIFAEIHKLQPGTLLKLPLADYRAGYNKYKADPVEWGDGVWIPRRYWSVKEIIRQGSTQQWKGSYTEACDATHALLLDSIKLRMVSDVPLGAFLSGGIDSSLVVALMQQVSTSPVKTFTIGFKEDQFNESDYARRVAVHLGTDHIEEFLTVEDARALIPTLPTMFDEPFGDSSQLPTFLVSQVARKQVTVALSGDGGDEFFGGYSRVHSAEKIWNLVKGLPPGLRRTLSRTMNVIGRNVASVSKLERYAQLISSYDCRELYLNIMSYDRRFPGLVNGVGEINLGLDPLAQHDIVDYMMFGDTVLYLPDDILTKVDRASMAVSLESREPLLDYRILELVWSFPQEWRYKDGRGKILLRDILARYVPKEYFERPKMGFSVPIASWLRGSMKEWCEDLLNESTIQQNDIFDHKQVARVLREHQSGSRDNSELLWNLLMFQAWKGEFLG